MGNRRPTPTWLAELGLAGLAALIGLSLFAGSVQEEPELGRLPELGFQLVGGVAAFAGLLLFRRSRPVALTVALVPIGLVSVPAMGATMVGLCTVAVHRRWPVAVAVAGWYAGAVAVLYGFASDSPDTVDYVILLVLVDITLMVSGMLVRSRRQLVHSLRERARQAEEGQRLRVEEARHAERERIAREMHDVLAHRISLLAVHAGALEFRRAAAPEERQAAGVIRQCAYEALEDLRQVIGMLREPGGSGGADDRPQPTIGDLPALVEQCRRAGAPVTLDTRLPDPVPDGIGRHVYRIVQEGLTNARKHAPDAPVRVTVAAPADDGLTVEVVNRMVDGVAPVIPGAGTGLIGLAERVQLVGGRLDHGRTPAGEFRLWAWLPCRT